MMQSASAFGNADQWDRFFDASTQVAALYHHQRRFQDSSQFLDSIQSHFGRNLRDDFKSVNRYYGALSWANLQSLNLLEADTWFSKTRELLQKNPQAKKGDILWTYYYSAVLYLRFGQNELALKYLDTCLEYGKNFNDNFWDSNIYNNKGIISRRIGEYEKALEYYTIAYNLDKSKVTKVQLTPILNNFAWLYHHLGDDTVALSYTWEGLQALEDYTEDYYSVESALRNTQAEILIDLGRYKEASTALNKNLERELNYYGENGFFSASTLINLGYLANQTGNYPEACNYYQQTKSIVAKKFGERTPRLAELNRKIGDNYLDQNKYDLAIASFQEALYLVAPTFDNQNHLANPGNDDVVLDKLEMLKVLQSKANSLLARYRLNNEKYDLLGAIDTNQKGVEVFNQVRQNLYYGESKQVLSELMKPVFEQSIEIALIGMKELPDNPDHLNQIFHSMEGSKSYILSSALQQSGKEGHSLLPDSLVQQQELLFLKTEYLSKQRNDLLSKSGLDSVALDEIKRELFLAREAYEDFKAKLNRMHPEYAQARFGTGNTDLSNISDALNNGDLLIEYFAGSRKLYALAVTETSTRVFDLGDYPSIEKDIKEYVPFSVEMDPKEYQEKSFKIFGKVLAPVLDGVEKTNIIIIPDGVLGYLPFDALVYEKIDEPSFLNLKYEVKRHTISQHYLASLYISDSKTGTRSDEFIGYAPDFMGEQSSLLATRSGRDSIFSDRLVRLPYARTEVETVSSLLNGKAVIGNQASEAHFKSNAATYKYLHVASHSIIDDESPLFSKLVFAKDENDTIEDGLLHAYELYGLKLDSDLVTLSACNTGMGQYKNGEGIMSLARGFIYAGASSVLMSLWEVADESTARIMETFYQEVNNGIAKAQAIQKAKLTYLNNADNITANPYYWAGFTYLGNKEKKSSNRWVYFTPLLLILISAAIWRRGKNAENRKGQV